MSQRSQTCRTDVDRDTLGALLLPDARCWWLSGPHRAGIDVPARPGDGNGPLMSRSRAEVIDGPSRISAV